MRYIPLKYLSLMGKEKSIPFVVKRRREYKEISSSEAPPGALGKPSYISPRLNLDVHFYRLF